MSMVTDGCAVNKTNKPIETRLKPVGAGEKFSNEQLVARIRAGENEADNMLQLWQQNRGFVYKVARRFSGYAEMDDLMQEGYIGLCEAVRQYDPDRGASFIHYAAFWIQQTLQRYIDNCCSAVRIPVHAQNDVRRYKRVVREYQKYYGCEPSERALCALLDVGQEKLRTIRENIRKGQIDSLSRVIGGDDEDITIADTVASGEDMEEDVIQELDRENMSRELWIAVDQLPDNLPAVMHLRYQNGMTLEQVGQEFGFSRNRARDLEAKALRMLRLPKRCKKFRSYHEEYISAALIHHVGVESFNQTWTSTVERDALAWCEKWEKEWIDRWGRVPATVRRRALQSSANLHTGCTKC